MDEKELNQIKNFNIQIYSIQEKFNAISYKARARIFYTGQNRNGTFISESFAEKLIGTAPYTPVKGIWDEELQDFKDHGQERTQGKIYGVVLEEPNFSWEEFTDDDGIVRRYACVDVIIYTEIYPEAKLIIGKSLSMELYPPSIKGEWIENDGRRVYAFEDASFAGLQALGNIVEPCFEGAQFFSLFNDFQELYNKIKEFNLADGGIQVMPKLNYKNSENENFEAIWEMTNPEYTEEANYTITTSICGIHEDYALCYDHENQELYKQYYSVEDGKVVFGCKKKNYDLDISEEDFNCLNHMKELNNNSFEKIDEVFQNLRDENTTYAATLSEREANIVELNNSLNEASEKTTGLQSALDELNMSYAAAQKELEELREYKCGIEKKSKNELLKKYSLKLDEEVIAQYTQNIENYTINDLEKELSYELVKATPSIFNLEEEPLIPKVTPTTGIEAILEKYKKGE